LGNWAVAGSGGGGWLVAADLLVLLVFMLIFSKADFGCAAKYFSTPQQEYNPSIHYHLVLCLSVPINSHVDLS
jgi:hypothetical protein